MILFTTNQLTSAVMVTLISVLFASWQFIVNIPFYKIYTCDTAGSTSSGKSYKNYFVLLSDFSNLDVTNNIVFYRNFPSVFTIFKLFTCQQNHVELCDLFFNLPWYQMHRYSLVMHIFFLCLCEHLRLFACYSNDVLVAISNYDYFIHHVL